MAYGYLPLEIIRKIFLYMNLPDKLAASAVCQQWYRAIHDGRLYDDMVVILQDDISRGMRVLEKTPRTFHSLVIKDGDVHLGNELFWKNVGPHLKRLEFIGCDVSERVFTAVLGFCPKLESLCICGCNGLMIPGTLLEKPEDITTLRAVLKNVKELDLSNNGYLSDALFNRLVSIVGNLESLCLEGCQISFHPGIYRRFYPPGGGISTSVLTFQNIMQFIESSKVKLKGINFSRTLLDSKAVERLVAACAETLTELRLVSCEQLSRSGILALCTNVPGLKVLSLGVNYPMTDQNLASICDHLTQLEELNLARCSLLTSRGVAEIVRLQRLQVLDLSCCSKVSSAGFIEALCTSPRPNMKRLDVSYCNIDNNVAIALTQSLPNLTYLDLTSCRLLTDEAVCAIQRTMQHLIGLRLAWCEEITDAGLYTDKLNEDGSSEKKSLARLKHLEQLDLCGCKKLSDVGLIASVMFLGLRYLNLSLCQRLTDDGLVHIAEQNRSLDHLILSQCVQLTDASVISVLQRLSRLHYLDVQGCFRLTDATLEHVSNCRRLRYLNVSLCGMTLPAISLLEDTAHRLLIVYKKLF